MRRLLPLVLSWACMAFATDRNSTIAGVWRAEMGGLPALVMTISDEGGDLTGAILFYLIRRDDGQPPHSSPGIPEPLFHLKFDGKVLEFQVSHRRAHPPRTAHDPPTSFQLRITSPNEGILTREENEAIPVRRDK